MDSNIRIALGNYDYVAYYGAFYMDQYWEFELVEDNLGYEWDYYFITNTDKRTRMLFSNIIGAKHEKYGTGYQEQRWRLVPRYVAKDEGYELIERVSGLV